MIFKMGLADAVHESILRCDDDKQPILYRNIMAMGGNVEFKNFRPRLLEGIRSLANDEYDVRVGDPKNPSQESFFSFLRLKNSFGGFRMQKNYKSMLGYVPRKCHEWQISNRNA